MAKARRATRGGRPSEWIGQWFWPHVDRSNPFGCWLWTGRRKSNEVAPESTYGSLSIEGQPYLAHRLAWMITYGSLRGLFVLHKCDVPLCVNPSHLCLGTREMNQQDALARGRLCEFQVSDDGDFGCWYDDDSLRDLLLDEDLRAEIRDRALVTAQPKIFDFARWMSDHTGRFGPDRPE